VKRRYAECLGAIISALFVLRGQARDGYKAAFEKNG